MWIYIFFVDTLSETACVFIPTLTTWIDEQAVKNGNSKIESFFSSLWENNNKQLFVGVDLGERLL